MSKHKQLTGFIGVLKELVSLSKELSRTTEMLVQK